MDGAVEKCRVYEREQQLASPAWEFVTSDCKRLSKARPLPQTHFVGFRDDRYWNAVAVFGEPHFIHMGWDKRALREIGDGDVIVFASGPHDQEPRAKSFPDILDGTEVNVPRDLRTGGR